MKKFNTAQIRVNCFVMVMAPAPWRTLGYRGLPRSGKFFDLWRPAWRIALDQTVRRELLAMYSAAFFVAGVTEDSSPNALADAYVETPELSRALQFSTQEEGKAYLVRAINKYMDSAPVGWGSKLLFKSNLPNIPNKHWKERFMRGAIYTVGAMDWPIARLRDEANNWDADKEAHPFYPAAVLFLMPFTQTKSGRSFETLAAR